MEHINSKLCGEECSTDPEYSTEKLSNTEQGNDKKMLSQKFNFNRKLKLQT